MDSTRESEWALGQLGWFHSSAGPSQNRSGSGCMVGLGRTTQDPCGRVAEGSRAMGEGPGASESLGGDESWLVGGVGLMPDGGAWCGNNGGWGDVVAVIEEVDGSSVPDGWTREVLFGEWFWGCLGGLDRGGGGL
ncbi:hypothetical protein V6N11_022501 [Hibiscus sabdariffa]|uniref:Uncharacterized protein n=1 Tax=Hibiscus sabdariffa TaxID=183260 RepID=A0ABR2TK50_9ROSI